MDGQVDSILRDAGLGHLKELPIDKVKIDRSFIHDLPANRDSGAITRAIVQMGHSLDITVIAEGVETEAQALYLRGRGVVMAQGFLFAPALKVGAFKELARALNRSTQPMSLADAKVVAA